MPSNTLLFNGLLTAIIFIGTTGAAFAGIEEHSPLPTGEEWEFIVLDDEFWNSADEANAQSEESDPMTSPLASGEKTLRNSLNSPGETMGNWRLQFQPRKSDREEDRWKKELLEEHLELKWKFAALGLEYLSESELENWRKGESGNTAEDGSTTNSSGTMTASAATSSNASTSSSDNEDSDDDSDDEPTTAEIERGLEYVEGTGEEEENSYQAGGCQQTFPGGIPLLLLLCGLFSLQATQRQLRR